MMWTLNHWGDHRAGEIKATAAEGRHRGRGCCGVGEMWCGWWWCSLVSPELGEGSEGAVEGNVPLAGWKADPIELEAGDKVRAGSCSVL